MTTNFMPDVGGVYCFATPRRVFTNTWDADSIDAKIARDTGVFPYTHRGRKLAELQRALLTETSMFWEWVDDYEFHT